MNKSSVKTDIFPRIIALFLLNSLVSGCTIIGAGIDHQLGTFADDSAEQQRQANQFASTPQPIYHNNLRPLGVFSELGLIIDGLVIGEVVDSVRKQNADKNAVQACYKLAKEKQERCLNELLLQRDLPLVNAKQKVEVIDKH